MHFIHTEEQSLIRESAKAFLAEVSTSEAVRAAMETEAGFDADLWRRISEDMGWAALSVPEAYGGLGLGAVELAILMEEAGNRLLCAPLFATLGLGLPALVLAASEDQKNEWLPQVADGSLTLTVTPTMSVTYASGGILSGVADLVPDAATAGLIIVAADGADGPCLFAIEKGAEGLATETHVTMDQTRRLGRVTLTDARGAAIGAPGEGGQILDHVLAQGSIALAAEAVGGAEWCLDTSVAYALQREQFGRPIGSFQAIKHKAADMMVRLESARSAAYYAACIVDSGSDELQEAAAIAKAYCTDAFFRNAGDAIQIHGGIGFTHEHDCHLYFKRARAVEALLGSPQDHRERLAQEIGLGEI